MIGCVWGRGMCVGVGGWVGNYSLMLHNVQTRDKLPSMILTWTINNLVLDGLMNDSDLSPTSWDFLSPPSAFPVPVWRQPDVQ